MARIPQPEHTTAGPAYHGRLLVHPDEPVVDQGARFDLTTLLSRRAVLSLVGAGVGAAALAACTSGATGAASATATTSTGSSASAAASSAGQQLSDSSTATTSGEIPDETAGPYPGDGSNGPDVLEQSGIVRSDLRSSLDDGAVADGVPLTFTLTVTDLAAGVPFAGVAVYAWHCDAQGRYSMYSEGIEDETYLRGVQVADADGRVTFTSVVPGCYSGRWPHIHFEVYPDVDAITDSTNAIATSQLALPEDAAAAVYELPAYEGSAQNLSQVTLATDNVFGDDGGVLQLATVTGDTTSGFTAALAVPVDTTTTPTGGDSPGGGAGGPSGSGGPGAPTRN